MTPVGSYSTPAVNVLDASIKRKVAAVKLSGKMQALVDYLLDQEPRTSPSITELVCTSDGFILAAVSGDIGANDIIGTRADFCKNIIGLSVVAELTPAEGERFLQKVPVYTGAVEVAV